jgi:hypothetical protein
VLIDQSSPGRHPLRHASGTNPRGRRLISVLAGQSAQAFPEGPAMNEGRAISRADDDSAAVAGTEEWRP